MEQIQVRLLGGFSVEVGERRIDDSVSRSQKPLLVLAYLICNRERVVTAKELLRRTDLTVTEVAASVGIRDVLHFSRFFSGREGISPSEYRRVKVRQKTEATYG